MTKPRTKPVTKSQLLRLVDKVSDAGDAFCSAERNYRLNPAHRASRLRTTSRAWSRSLNILRTAIHSLSLVYLLLLLTSCGAETCTSEAGVVAPCGDMQPQEGGAE